jgi:tetratricopeptide (TPR) repeat protein
MVVQLAGAKDAGLSYSERGDVYFQQGDYSAAVADFSKAIDLNLEAQHKLGVEPSDAYYYTRGLAYMKLKNYKAALDDFLNAINIEPNMPEYYESRSKVYEALGQSASAKKDAATAKTLRK